MATSIHKALSRIKGDLEQILNKPLIDEAARHCEHVWRERVLDPIVTIHLFVLQILHGNTACSHLRHLTKKKFSSSAYCQARARLPLELLQAVVRRIVLGMAAAAADTGLWRGHRIWLADGSGFSMPDTPSLQACFGQPAQQKPGCGFPVASMLTLFDASSGLLVDVLARPQRSHDMSGIALLHHNLRPGDVLLADRGFSSYAHLALIFTGQMHAVFRLHQRQIVSFHKGRKHAAALAKDHRRGRPASRFVRKLDRFDQWVEYLKPKQSPKWMDAEAYAVLPQSIRVRELSYWVKQPGYRTRRITLVTTLLDPKKYPAAELAKLYGQRWQVETNLRHLKTTMRMDVLRTKTPEGVRKELTVFILVYNLVRLTMLEAASCQGVNIDRISFVDALRWLASAMPGEPLPPLIINPFRPGRVEPRVRKRRQKEFPVMQSPRSELRKALLKQQVAA